MLETIKDIIVKSGRASEYRISQRRKSGLEWYFVKDKLDSARDVETTLYDVTVYVDGLAAADGADGRTRGECTVLVQPGSAAAEISAIIGRALDTAAGMKNAWFPLPKPSAWQPIQPASRFDGLTPLQAMEAVRAALYRHDGLDGASINSLEIFLSCQRQRLVTSTGVDVAWSSWVGFSEFVVNAGKRGQDEVELYADLRFADLDEAQLSEATRRQLAAARDRLVAVPTPALSGLPLLLAGKLAADVYEYWFENAQAMAVYEKRAAFGPGDDVAAGGGDGALLNLRAVPTLAGSPLGAPYDLTGFALKPVDLIRDNQVVGLVAASKYAHYLKLPATGAIQLFELGGGRTLQAELRQRDHLEVLTFSDFFVDSTTGDFGGEIRLGYLVRDGRRQPVYGGAVTGNLVENRGRLLLSSEREGTPMALAPTCCLLPAVSVTPGG